MIPFFGNMIRKGATYWIVEIGDLGGPTLCDFLGRFVAILELRSEIYVEVLLLADMFVYIRV